MSTATIVDETTRVGDLHLIRWQTFDTNAAAEVALRSYQASWPVGSEKESIPADFPTAQTLHYNAAGDFQFRYRVDRLHDVFSIHWQASVPGTVAAESLTDLLKDSPQAFPDGGASCLGKTTVVLVRTDGNRISLATTLAQGLGMLQPESLVLQAAGDGLWVASGLDPAFIILLATWDTDEAAIGRLLLGPLRLLEIMRHKLAGQMQQYATIRQRLAHCGRTLDEQLLHLEDELAADGSAPSRTLFLESLRSNQRTLAAYRELTDALGLARQVLVSLRANRFNLARYARELPLAAHDPLVRERLQLADTAAMQVETDLGYYEPSQKLAEWVSHFHQSRMLTWLALVQSRENEQHEQETDRRDRSVQLITALAALWALVQIWAVAVSTYIAANQLPWSFLTTVTLMLAPAALGAIATYRFLIQPPKKTEN